jgi:signal transduction histidine kinase
MPIVTQDLMIAIKENVGFFTHKPYKIITKNNNVKWVLDNTLITKDSNGNITHFLGYIADVTELKNYELNLKDIVKQKTQEILKQQDILKQQAKLAEMGEMIGAIAHQWRQPLNALGINIQSLIYDFEDDLINKEFLEEFIGKNLKTIKFMSNTIDDFRNFFRIDKHKALFSAKEAINATLSIQKAQLKAHNIDIDVTGDDFKILGYMSEFQQVILNIISNSKDAVVENNIQEPYVKIVLAKPNITIEDNAGGIPKDIIQRVFEPYFTTKEQGKGTGIGLYMSKMIIENNMNGRILLNNTGKGVLTTIITKDKS